MGRVDGLGMAGRVIDGQFRVDEVAGEGDLTLVYKGHHLGLDVPVAIKCLNLPSTLDAALVPSLVASFGEGSRVHYELSQGNLYIARSISSGMAFAPARGQAVPYLVREWLEGTSLAKELARRRAEGLSGRPLHEVVEVLDPPAAAIAYAHARGVVHGRLHPTNLFVTKVGEGTVIKVLDFGLAGAIHDTKRDMTKAASELSLFFPAYAAPEQFDKSIGEVGAATDVYALALLVLELLRDRPPVAVRATVDLASVVFDRKNRPTPEALGIPVGAEVAKVLARAVAVEPKARYADAAAFWEALKHALFVEGVPSSKGEPTSEAETVRRPETKDDAPAPAPPPLPAPVKPATAVMTTSPHAFTPGGTLKPAPPRPGTRAFDFAARANAAVGRASGTAAAAVTELPAAAAPAAPEPPASDAVVLAPGEPIVAEEVPSRNAPPPAPPKKHIPTLVGITPQAAATPPAEARPSLVRAEASGMLFLTPGEPISVEEIPVASVAPPVPPRRHVPTLLGITPQAPEPAPEPAPAPAPAPPIAPAYAPQPLPYVPLQHPLHARRGGRAPLFYVLLAVGGLVVFVLVATATFWLAGGRARVPAPPAASTEPAPAPSASAVASTAPPASTPPRAASAAAPPVPAAAASSAAPPDTRKAFTVADAYAAIRSATKDIARCKKSGARTGRGLVRVTFSPDDGTVVDVAVQSPFAKTPPGDCVEGMIRHARMNPYKPPKIPIIYQFEIPK